MIGGVNAMGSWCVEMDDRRGCDTLGENETRSGFPFSPINQ